MNCNEATKAIVQKRKPNFLYVAFVDPTGLDIHFDTIRSLAGDLRCDLIINWFMSALTRNMSVWQQGQESERLDRFFGTHEWVQCVPPTVTPKVAFQCLVKLYRQQLERIGYGYQAQPQIIKNRQNAEMYWLWFASRSGTGKDFWLKAVKSAREQREFDFDDRT
jgi:three-Cys-motif partner protein